MNSTAIIERSDWSACGVVLLSLVAAAASFQFAFLIACFGIPVALVWMSRILFVHRRRPALPRAMGFLCALILLVVGPTVIAIQTARLEIRLTPLIEALEAQRTKYGEYPKTLSELTHPVEATCAGDSTRKVIYSPRDGGSVLVDLRDFWLQQAQLRFGSTQLAQLGLIDNNRTPSSLHGAD